SGDLVDAQIGFLEELLGVRDPLLGDPLLRCRSRLVAEPARERTRRHHRAFGERLHPQRFLEMLAHPVQQRAEGFGVVLRLRRTDELRLPAVAMRGYDDPAGERARDLGAEMLAYD